MNSLYFCKQLYFKNRAKPHVLVCKSNKNNSKTRNRTCAFNLSTGEVEADIPLQFRGQTGLLYSESLSLKNTKRN